MTVKAKINPARALAVVRIIVAPADDADLAVLVLGFKPPAAAPAVQNPDRHAYRMSGAQLRELRAQLDVAIGALESREAPKH